MNARSTRGVRSWWPWAVAAIVVAGVAVLPLTWNNLYYQNMIILGMVLAIAGVSWNVLGGFAGYISLGHSAFIGVGAYATAITSVELDWPLWASLLAAVAVTAVVAAVTALVALRTRGIAFIMVTFAMLELLRVVAMNVPELTRGNHGISLPILELSRQTQQWPAYYGLLAVLVVSMIGVVAMQRSKLGTGLLAIREDEDKAAAIGIVTPRYKMVAFVISALPVGLAGGLYAFYLGYIEPAGMFSIFVAMQIVLVALLGGRGTILGPLVGAAIVEPLSQFTNQQIGGPDAGSWRLILLGALIAVVVLVLPRGVLPTVGGWIRRLRRGRDATAVTGVRVSDSSSLHVRDRDTAPAVPEPADAILRVRDLRKNYGGVAALDGCEFEVPRGSITALIGPNGSGKTTAFNVIDGTTPAASGSVQFDGHEIGSWPRWARAHAGLGRTYQTTRLFAELTVRENLVAPVRDAGVRTLVRPAFSGGELERAEEALELVGLGAYLEHEAGSLSYGQQKLVELAQCIVRDPKLILLDEPSAGINPALVDRMVEIVLDLQSRGTTFLIVEHNMPLVLSLCNPVHVLARGRRIASGTPAAIKSDPLVLEAYLGAEAGVEVGA